MMINKFYNGRVFIVGGKHPMSTTHSPKSLDAAHIHSPTGGQGTLASRTLYADLAPIAIPFGLLTGSTVQPHLEARSRLQGPRLSYASIYLWDRTPTRCDPLARHHS